MHIGRRGRRARRKVRIGNRGNDRGQIFELGQCNTVMHSPVLHPSQREVRHSTEIMAAATCRSSLRRTLKVLHAAPVSIHSRDKPAAHNPTRRSLGGATKVRPQPTIRIFVSFPRPTMLTMLSTVMAEATVMDQASRWVGQSITEPRCTSPAIRNWPSP